MKTAESKTTSAATTAAKTPNAPFFSQEPQAEPAFFGAQKADSESFFSPQTIQPKLKIGAANDHYEQQADAVADRVVKTIDNGQSEMSNRATPSVNSASKSASAPSSPSIQSKSETNQQEEKLQKKDDIESTGQQIQKKPIFDSAAEPPPDDVQRKTDGNFIQRSPSGEGEASPDFSSQLASSKSGGSTLPSETQQQMGNAMGADFSGVRVHTGSEAANLSESIGAQAFTHGNDVYFNEGKYNPSTTEGSHLLAHELTHTVQQGAAVQRKTDDETAKHKNIETPAADIQRLPTAILAAHAAPNPTTAPTTPTTSPTTTPAVRVERPTSRLDITQRFEPDEAWRTYLAQSTRDVEVLVKIGNDYEGTITIRRRAGTDAANPVDTYQLVGSHEYLDVRGMAFLDPLRSASVVPILHLNPFGSEGQTTGFLSVRSGTDVVGNVLGLIASINHHLEAMRFIGLAPLDVPNGGISNVFENGRLAFEVTQLSTTIDGYLTANGTIGIVGGNFTFNLESTVTLQGLATGQFNLARNETGDLSGRANIDTTIANIEANLLVEYDAGAVTIQGTGRIQSEKFRGSITLLVTDAARSRQMMHAALGVEAMDQAAANPVQHATPKTATNQVIAGWGEVTATITDWLEGTAKVGIDAQGHVTVVGELVVTEEKELMEQRLKRYDLFELEVRAGYGIPLLAQVAVFARLKMFINAGLGPLVLRDIRFTGTYSTDPSVMQQFSITGTLSINAFAVLALAVEAGAGLTILGHDLNVGINGTAAAGIRAYALATPTFEYREQASPEGGKVGESHLRGHFEAAAQLFLQLSGSLFYEIDSPWWSPVPDGREDFPLGELQYPIGDSLGIGADVDWLVGSSDVPELTFSPVEFDADQFTADILADPPPGRLGADEAEPAGDWQDGTEGGGAANPEVEGGGAAQPHGAAHEENLRNLPDEQKYMRGLSDISDIAAASHPPSIAQVRTRITAVKNRYGLDNVHIENQAEDHVMVLVSHAQQNNRDHLVQIPIINAAEQQRLSTEAITDLNARLTQQAGEAHTLSQTDAQAVSHEWQLAHPVVESVRVVDGHARWDFVVDFGEHNQTVHGKAKTSDDTIQNALKEIDTEGDRESDEGVVTLSEAEQIKNQVNTNHSTKIEITSIRDAGETWDFEYIQKASKSIRSIPLGFVSFQQFRQFSEAAQAVFARAGFSDTTLYMEGSAATGTNIHGVAFDVGRTSDFDVAVISSSLMQRARELGFVSGGGRIRPLDHTDEARSILQALGIADGKDRLSSLAGRPVNFLISELRRGSGIRLPTRF